MIDTMTNVLMGLICASGVFLLLILAWALCCMSARIDRMLEQYEADEAQDDQFAAD